MLISVVVPTHGRPELLERCVRALLSQSIGCDDYEIIIVDDACSGQTFRQITNWQSDPVPMPLLKHRTTEGHCGPAVARNVGWRSAVGAIVAFTDDDTIPDKDWLRHGLSCFTTCKSVVAARGRVVVPVNKRPTDYELNESNLAHCEFVTANCFVKKQTLEQIGGFSEDFRTAWREDSELYFKLIKWCESHASTIADAKAAVVIHPVRAAAWGVSITQQKKSLYNALLYKLYPDLYKKHIQSSPPLLYYSILLTAVGGLISTSSGLTWLGMILMGCWIALTVKFFLKRIRNTSHNPSHLLEMAVTSVAIPFLSVYWRLYGAVRFRVFFL